MALVWMLSAACTAKSEKIPGLPKSRRLTETGKRDLEKKQGLDQLMKRNRQKILVFVNRVGSDSVERVERDEFPDSIRTTYNLYYDDKGRLAVASEFPFSESGDWSVRLTHYFDAAGRTFAFERDMNFFNSICTPGMAHENRNYLLDTSGRIVDSLYLLLDKEQKNLKRQACQFPYEFPYTIHPNASAWLATNRLSNSKNR